MKLLKEQKGLIMKKSYKLFTLFLRRCLIVLFILFFMQLLASRFIGNNCSAQWVQMSTGIGNQPIYSLVALGNNIFAGTVVNGVYLSTNNGVSWTQTSLNNRGVTCLATLGNTIFAGTNQNGVYISTNNGTNWTQITMNYRTILSLATLGNTIFAGTSLYGVYLSTNNGMNWTQTSLNNKDVWSLATLENNIFAGTFLYGVYLSTNNGANWTQTASNNQVVYSLATLGNNIFAGTLFSGVYLSTNNGTNWTQTALNNKDILSLVALGNNIFAGTDSNGVYLSTNNGDNWFVKNQGFSVISKVWSLLIVNNYIFAGTWDYSVWRRSYTEIIGIQNISTEIPLGFSLSQNYPNPFNPQTTIEFSIKQNSYVTFKIYDITGKEVMHIFNNLFLNNGSYKTYIDFSKTNLSSGIYFYKLDIRDNKSLMVFTETKKMSYIK